MRSKPRKSNIIITHTHAYKHRYIHHHLHHLVVRRLSNVHLWLTNGIVMKYFACVNICTSLTRQTHSNIHSYTNTPTPTYVCTYATIMVEKISLNLIKFSFSNVGNVYECEYVHVRVCVRASML